MKDPDHLDQAADQVGQCFVKAAALTLQALGGWVNPTAMDQLRAAFVHDAGEAFDAVLVHIRNVDRRGKGADGG